MASVLEVNPAFNDLKIIFKESILVSPPQEQTDQKSPIFLSNVDQILNYNIPTVHFFAASPDFPPETVAERLKSALAKVLVPYDFMAGRFKVNHDLGRLEIDCNGAGVGFVVASCDQYSLEDLGDLIYPNLGFRQLAVQVLDNLGPDQDLQPLCVIQVTSFKCGGFAIGMCTNHVLLDGIGALTFIENLASQAFDDGRPLVTIPCHNRQLLAARTPPHVDFQHPEYFKPDHLPESGVPVFDCNKEELQYKVFRLTLKAINYLKDQAIKTSSSKTKITSFNVVAALIWRCKALSAMDTVYKGDKDHVSTFLNVVDIRQRIDPPLPLSYCGNGVLVAYATAKCGDILENWGSLVEMVSKGPDRVTNEYARSVIDWLGINKGLPSGEYMVSSWLRLRFDQVVYPWGKPLHSGPVVSHRKDICWVFAAGGVINALVSLPAEQMERFDWHFRQFLHTDGLMIM